jgi:predicted acyl esterase
MNISLFLKNILFVSVASVIYAQNAQEFMIPFDDGIKFHTAILTPDTTNKYPVVVYRTPYANKKETLDKKNQLCAICSNCAKIMNFIP